MRDMDLWTSRNHPKSSIQARLLQAMQEYQRVVRAANWTTNQFKSGFLLHGNGSAVGYYMNGSNITTPYPHVMQTFPPISLHDQHVRPETELSTHLSTTTTSFPVLSAADDISLSPLINEESFWREQIFENARFHSLAINILSLVIEGSAIIANALLLFYCALRIRWNHGTWGTDVSFGLAMHLGLVGFLLSIFMVSMHSLLLTFKHDQESIAEWSLLCIYYLNIRDALASLYLYVLVVNVLMYTQVTFPPRTAHNARCVAYFTLIHAIPWVVSMGASLPICILNLHGSQQSYSIYRRHGIILEGMCILNTKSDMISLFLEMILFILPLLIIVGLGVMVIVRHCHCTNAISSVSPCRGRNRRRSCSFLPEPSYQPILPSCPHPNNCDRPSTASPVPRNVTCAACSSVKVSQNAATSLTPEVTYSHSIILLLSTVTLFTQAPLAFSRLAAGLLEILQQGQLMSHTLTRYITQLHCILFSIGPVILLCALYLLHRSYQRVAHYFQVTSQSNSMKSNANNHSQMPLLITMQQSVPMDISPMPGTSHMPIIYTSALSPSITSYSPTQHTHHTHHTHHQLNTIPVSGYQTIPNNTMLPTAQFQQELDEKEVLQTQCMLTSL